MAKQSPLTSVSPIAIPGEDPELAASRQKYIAAQQAMLDALQARNEFIDPRNLAMARAFLQPTKSGRFGESLGNVMEAYGTADEAERKRNIDIAQIKAEMAAREVSGHQQATAMKEFNRLIGGQPEATQGTGAPAGVQAGALSSTQAGAPEGAGSTAGLSKITPQAIARLKLINPDYGKIVEDMVKLDQDRYLMSQNGTVFDKARGAYLEAIPPGQTQSEFELPGLGKFLMTAGEYSTATRSRAKAASEGWREDWDRQFLEGTNPDLIRQPGAPGRPRDDGALATAPGGMKRKTTTESALEAEERKAQLATRTAAETKLAESAAGRTSQVFEQASAAKQADPTYARIQTILQRPGMDAVKGVLERSGALAQIGSLVDEAVRINSFTIGIPAIRKVITQANTPQHLIDSAMELASAYAQLNFDARKGLGSGTSVSNFEQQMVNQMGISMADTVASAKAKLAFLREQAKFRQQVGSALKEARKKSPGLQYDDFEETPEFTKMFNDYKARQEANVKRAGQSETPRGEVIQPGRPAAPRAGTGQERKIDGKTYVRQPDGSYKLKE